jgi:hypothetical protein
MTNRRTSDDRHTVGTSFEIEPSDEWREDYGRGGPVRSDPERDWFFESTMEAPDRGAQERKQHRARPPTPVNAERYESSRPAASVAPSHRGRGPKGYVPSDRRLYEIICERLTDDPFIDAHEMSVEVLDRVVTLTGTVESRRMKFAAESLVARIGGIVEIHNQLGITGSSH